MPGQGSEGSGFKLPYGKTSTPSEPKPEPIDPESKSSFFSGIIDLLKRIASRVGPTERQIFYEISSEISTYGTAQTAALSDDSSSYIRERVFERLGMNAPKINVYNDGPGTWYIRHTHDGNNFSEEFPIFEGEAKSYENIYELRHRAPLATLKYRITEFDLWKQKNVDFKAGRGYIRNQQLAVGNVAPLVAYTTADTHAIFTTIQRNATTGYIKNLDISATLYVWVSEDGIEFGAGGVGLDVEYITVQPLSVFHIDGWSLHTIMIGADANLIDYEVVGG